MYYRSIIILTLVLLFPVSLYSQIRTTAPESGATRHEPQRWSPQLISVPGDRFSNVELVDSSSGDRGLQSTGVADDTTAEGTLEIRSGFLKGTQYSVGSANPQKVYNFWGSYSDGFRQTLGRHPAALQEADRASVWNTVRLASAVAMLVITTDYQIRSSSADLDFNRSREEVSFPILPFVGVASTAVFSMIRKKAHLNRSVQVYNEMEGGSTEAVILDRQVIPKTQSRVATGVRTETNRLESWYTNWGLGYAGIGYPSELEIILESLSDVDGVSHAAVSMDLLSFYLPRGEHTLIGAGVNTFGDAYTFEGESLSIGGATFALSAMHFLRDRIGRGFFLRADAGPARIRVTSTVSPDASASGFGFLVGGGYGIPVSSGTRLLLNANYSNRSVEHETYSTFNLSVSGLF